MADEPTGTPGPVPYERYKEMVDRANTLKSEIRAAKTEAEGYKAKIAEYEPKLKGADEMAAQIEKLKADHKAEVGTLAETLGMARAGITDDTDAAVARTLYGLLPAEGKPKSIGDWLGSLKAEGVTPPKQLAHLFTPPVATPAPPAAPPARPNPGGGGSAPPSGAKPGAAQIREAHQRFTEGKMSSTELQAVLDASRRL